MTAFLPQIGVQEFERESGGVSVLVLNRAKIAAMGLPGGMIYKWASAIGDETKEEARGLLISHGSFKTGRLFESTKSSATPVVPLPGVQINVRATADHALYYIKGTRPHVISTVGKRKIVYQSGRHKGEEDWGFMKFFWFKGGFIRYEQSVFHPGWHGYNYLDDAKEIVLARHHIII